MSIVYWSYQVTGKEMLKAYLYASIYRHEVIQTSIFLCTGKFKILTNIESPLLPFIEAYLYPFMEAYLYHILKRLKYISVQTIDSWIAS